MNFLSDFPDAKLYYAMAKDHVKDPVLWDDCVQEAIIEVWRVKQTHPDKVPAYYNSVARRRIKRVGSTQLFLDAPPELCAKWMSRKKTTCGRRENHPGDCQTRESLKQTSSSPKRRTNASHDVLRRPHDSYEQRFLGWQITFADGDKAGYFETR